jgi:hypothetical protein
MPTIYKASRCTLWGIQPFFQQHHRRPAFTGDPAHWRSSVEDPQAYYRRLGDYGSADP